MPSATDRSKLREAKDPSTSAARLRELFDQGFARAIAQNPGTPSEMLEQMSYLNDPEVRGFIAENPNTPMKALFRLGSTYPTRVVRNPILPLLLVENPDLFSGISQETLRFLLTKEDIPEAFLMWAFQNLEHLRIREAIARNPKTPVALLEKLCLDPRETVREGAAKNPNTPQEFLQTVRRLGLNHDLTSEGPPDLSLSDEVLASFLSWGDFACRLIASHPKTSAKTLEALLQMKGDSSRNFDSFHYLYRISRNQGAPAELLRRFAQQSDVLRCVVAENPAAPEALLEEMFKDKNNADLRKSLALNPKLPLSMLDSLARDKIRRVRLSAARNPSLPEALRSMLLVDKSVAVRQGLVYNPNISPEILARLSKDKKIPVRFSVACQEKTPREALVRLSQDNDLKTREAAKRTLKRAEKKE